MTRPSKLSKQLAKSNDGVGNNKARTGLAAEIQRVIDAHNQLAQIVQKSFDEVNNRANDTSIILQSIAQIVGLEKVNEGSKAIRIKLLEDEAAQQGKNVAKGVEDGKLVKVDKVDGNCLIVTAIKKVDGSPMYPSKNYLPYGYYKPEIQVILKDKGVGSVLEMPAESGGGTIEVLEIYVEAKEETPPTT